MIPDGLYYLLEHQVWARDEGDATATTGITQLGIQLSGEIYMCRPKRAGTEIAQGGTIAVVELAKSIVAVKSAVSGTVIAINEELRDRPQLIHQDPYGAGWIARLKLTDFAHDRAALLHGDAAREAMERYAAEHADAMVPATTPTRRAK